MLIHVDSSQVHGELSSRMAYVSVSRAQFDVQMYTNDAKALGYGLILACWSYTSCVFRFNP